jgi:hypothetical protein
MRPWVPVCLLFALPALVFGQKNVPLDELISRAGTAPNNAKPALCTEIAERELQAADNFYSSGDSGSAYSAVRDVVMYSGEAAHAANETGSRLKPTEIALRKMADRLRAIRHNLSVDDQRPVEDAASRLEELRSELLAGMFAKHKGKAN